MCSLTRLEIRIASKEMTTSLRLDCGFRFNPIDFISFIVSFTYTRRVIPIIQAAANPLSIISEGSAPPRRLWTETSLCECALEVFPQPAHILLPFFNIPAGALLSSPQGSLEHAAETLPEREIRAAQPADVDAAWAGDDFDGEGDGFFVFFF